MTKARIIARNFFMFSFYLPKIFIFAPCGGKTSISARGVRFPRAVGIIADYFCVGKPNPMFFGDL